MWVHPNNLWDGRDLASTDPDAPAVEVVEIKERDQLAAALYEIASANDTEDGAIGTVAPELRDLVRRVMKGFGRLTP